MVEPSADIADPFGPAWAAEKLNLVRRKRELDDYVRRYLPELDTMPRGLVVDVGCGPGDLAPLVKDKGHDYLGIDAPPDVSEMGEAYIEECRKLRNGYRVLENSLKSVLTNEHGYVGNNEYRMPYHTVCCIVCRGAIEQCLQHAMFGSPHREHHDAKQLDWNVFGDCNFVDARRGVITDLAGPASLWLWKFCDWCERYLRQGGILLVSANGTRSTDRLYDERIRKHASDVGLVLVEQDGLLNHKWVKSRD